MTIKHLGRILLGAIVTPLVATLFVVGTSEARGQLGGDGDGDGDGEARCYICGEPSYSPTGVVTQYCEGLTGNGYGYPGCRVTRTDGNQTCENTGENDCRNSSSEVNGDGSIAPESDARTGQPAVRMVAVAYRGSTFSVSACDGTVLAREYTPAAAETMRAQTRSITL